MTYKTRRADVSVRYCSVLGRQRTVPDLTVIFLSLSSDFYPGSLNVVPVTVSFSLD